MNMSRAFHTYLPTLARGWDWWIDGFRGTSPASQMPRLPRAVIRDGAPIDPATGRPPRRASRIALSVPGEKWLTLAVALPDARPEEHHQMARFEIGNLTPFAAEDTWFGIAPGGSAIHLVPKKAVAADLAAASRAGHSVTWLCHQDQTDATIALTAASSRMPKLPLLVLAGAVALGLAGAGLWMAQDQEHAAAEARLASLAQAARKTRQIEAEIAAFSAEPTDQSLMPGRADTVALLEAVTATLPDSSFLNALSLGADKMVISGIGTGIEATIRDLSEHPLFHRVEIAGPLQRLVDGKTAFELRITLPEATP